MNILMLSTDKKILDSGSEVAKRMREYGSICTKLTILLLGIGERQVLELSDTVHVVFPGGTSKSEAFKNSLWEGMREGRDLPASLVSVQDPFFVGFVGWRIARALHVPLQAQVHTDFLSRNYYLSSVRRFFDVLLAFFILSQASCVRVVSQRIAKNLPFVPKKNITVLPIRVRDVQSGNTCPEEFTDAPRILMVSRLEPEKRIGNAIRAMQYIRDAHLYIIGDGSLRDSLGRLACNLNVDARVHFLGQKKNVSPYYEHAHAFLHLSRFEGYGLALVEAGLAGLPIVTTDVGVVGSVLLHKKSAIVIKNDNVNTVVRSLTQLFSDRAYAAGLGERARRHSEKEIRDNAEYLALYRKALENCMH